MGSRWKGKKGKQKDRGASWPVLKLLVYGLMTLAALAVLWYFYLGSEA